MMFKKACNFLRVGKAEKAAKILKKLASNEPGWCDAVYNLGVAYMLQERKQEAISAFLRTIDIDPKVGPAYSNLCYVLTKVEKFEKAVEYGEKGLSVDPFYVPMYNSLALALEPLGRFEEAIGYLRRALLFNSNDIKTLTNLWGVLYRTGRKKEAEEVILKYLQLKPDNAYVHRVLSKVREYSSGDEHILQMERLLEIAPEEADLHFALGKAYESIGDYKQSFEHYDAGNKLYRRTSEYSSDRDKRFFEQLRHVYTKDFIEHCEFSGRSETPIFVVGMPRSGTSLTEQILASHPDVYGAGEVGYTTIMQHKTFNFTRENYAASVRKLSPNDFARMAELFLKKLERVWGDHRYVVDKTPQNFLFLGLIKILFPDAKIIHCKRDPRDVCLSIFKIFFAREGELSFSSSQKDIVEYYKLYEELMVYWHDVLPEGSIYDIQYETLIENPEESIHALLAHCDLEWHDGCMEFHKTKRAVKTASALQVRKPIYKGAMGYWKNYESYLDEIVSAF
jgi:tetratricopeptide (TPR) repeat protein